MSTDHSIVLQLITALDNWLAAEANPGSASTDPELFRQLHVRLAQAQEKFDRTDPLSSGNVRAKKQPEQTGLSARLYFDYALNGLIETDGAWQILRANPAAASITGIDSKPLCHLSLHCLADQQSQARLQQHLTLLQEQGISHGSWQMPHPHGGNIELELASVQVDEDLYLHVFDDVTAQRRASAALEAARQQAEAATQAKSAFLANISHEIRTPMNGVLGLTQLLLHTRLDKQQTEYVITLRESGQRLLRLLNDLLDSAKLEAGRMTFAHEPYRLGDLLADLEPLRLQAEQNKAVTLRLTRDPALPAALYGDRLRISQCICNLLSNAIKFTVRGSIEIRLLALPGSAEQPARWACSVRDTGPGLSPEQLATLFTPFSQADHATARHVGGTGLGLYISRELALGMGGELSASSTPGEGSCFTLTLPLEPAPCPASAEISAEDVPQEFRGRTIFVAEDDRVNQLVIRQWLQLAGIHCQLAGDGNELLAMTLATAERPELILMDVQMPGMDGLTATARLRQAGYSQPIIALSAGAGAEDEARCLAAGMDDFLAKPLDPEALWGCLTRWLPAVSSQRPIRPAGPTADGVGLLNQQQTAALAERFMGNHQLLKAAQTAFVHHHATDGDRLREQLLAGDLRAATHLLHTLKGAAATLELQALAEAARQLETLLQPHNHHSPTLPDLGELQRLLHQAIHALGQ